MVSKYLAGNGWLINISCLARKQPFIGKKGTQRFFESASSLDLGFHKIQKVGEKWEET